MKYFRALTLLIFTLASNPLHADEEQQRLHEVNSTIEELLEVLQAQRGEISTVEAELATFEKQISTNARALAAAEDELDLRQRELSAMREQVRVATARKVQSESQLADTLRQIWMQRDSNGLSVLLSGDANEQQRLSYYYQVMSEAQRDALNAFREEVAALAQLEAELEASVARVDTQRQLARRQLVRLRQSQQQREQALESLRTMVASSGTRIEQLQAERVQLERIIEELSRAIGSLSAPDRVPFASLKGQLPVPNTGQLISRFGDTRNAHIKWRGHRYLAPVGDEVRSVGYGRVVYANWLSGQGLLIAIDHGDNFLTLYANNQSLLKSVGEWVEAGEVIATVGNSGGLDDAALYFEIRKNGEPLDPKEWIE